MNTLVLAAALFAFGWDPSPSPDVYGYVVHRQCDHTPAWSGAVASVHAPKVGEAIPTEYVDADTLLDGQTCSYWLTTIGAGGAESLPSARVTTTMPSDPVTPQPQVQ